MVVGIEIERVTAGTERLLSYGAVIPVLGAIAGAFKMILGTIQVVGGILGMIVSAPFVWRGEGRHVFSRAGSHTINGLANVVAGALEAIPLVGSVIAGVRIYRSVNGSDSSYRASSGQEHAIIVGYRTLEESPCYYNIDGDEVPAEDVPLNRYVHRTSPLFSI